MHGRLRSSGERTKAALGWQMNQNFLCDGAAADRPPTHCCKACNTCPPLTLMCVFVCERIILPLGASAGLGVTNPRWKAHVMLQEPQPLNRCKTGRDVLLTCLTRFLFSSPSSHREHHQEQTLRKWICQIYLLRMPNANIKISPPPRCF